MKRAYNKYSDNWVIAEAYLVLEGYLYEEIANIFRMPTSTVGWHVKYRLRDVDKVLYDKVRKIITER